MLTQVSEPLADGNAVRKDEVPGRGAAVAVRLQQPRCLGDAAVVKEPGDSIDDVTAAAKMLGRGAARVDRPA